MKKNKGGRKHDKSCQEEMCESCESEGFGGGMPCPDVRCVYGTFAKEITVGSTVYRRSIKDGKPFWLQLPHAC